MKERGKYMLAGAVAGAVNGLFGGGGGIPLALLLTRWAKVREKIAFACCVAVILPVCLVSVAVYALRGGLQLGAAMPYLVGGAAGGLLGAKLFKNVKPTLLRRLFGIFLLYGGARYLL